MIGSAGGGVGDDRSSANLIVKGGIEGGGVWGDKGCYRLDGQYSILRHTHPSIIAISCIHLPGL